MAEVMGEEGMGEAPLRLHHHRLCLNERDDEEIDLVVDVLATLLKKAREASMIRGLVPDLVEGGLTHL
jgi:hypothetical protein